MNPYVFFVGCARSGTTLVERLADAHSMLAIIHASRWIVRLYENGTGLTPDGRVTPGLIEQLAGHPRFNTLRMEESDLRRVYDARPADSYAEFVTALFDLYAEREGKQHAGDRTPEYVKSVPLLHELWPAARFVHIIRDGRNVSLSVADWKKGARKFPTWDEDPVSTTAVWWERNVRLTREAGAALEPDLYHELRYESLVADSAAECARLCDFLGLPFDERMVRFHEGRTRDDPGLNAKKAWRPVTPGLRDWQSQMAPDDLVRFEAAAGDLLEELGYPRATPSPPPAALEHAARIRGAYVGHARATGLPIPGSWGAMA